MNVCWYEGCDYGDGGACWRCGSRLRCHACRCFITVSGYETHFEAKHGDLIEETCCDA